MCQKPRKLQKLVKCVKYWEKGFANFLLVCMCMLGVCVECECVSVCVCVCQVELFGSFTNVQDTTFQLKPTKVKYWTNSNCKFSLYWICSLRNFHVTSSIQIESFISKRIRWNKIQFVYFLLFKSSNCRIIRKLWNSKREFEVS